MMAACHGKVLGLKASGNGRSCGQHNCCDIFVVPNNILHFKLTVIDGVGGGKVGDNEDITPEEAIKAVLVWDGTKLCTMGFLSKSVVAVEKDSVLATKWMVVWTECNLLETLRNEACRRGGRDRIAEERV